MADIINRLNVGQTVNVKLTDSAVTNGQNLVEAYNYAKTLTPNGAALSATNRVSVIIPPGNYTFVIPLTVDTQFVDLIGLGAIKLRRGCVPAVRISTPIGGPLFVTANDVRVKGISVGTSGFNIGSNLPLQIFEDCLGGNSSFVNTIVAGTFINCTGSQNSFNGFILGGGPQTINGTFINCLGADNSFCSRSIDNVASGLFVNCSSDGNSFGSAATASGTFIDCEGGAYAFGGSVSAVAVASGTFINCVGGLNAFGNGGSATATGKFYRCRLTSGTFRTVTGTGLMRNCIDGNDNIVNQ